VALVRIEVGPVVAEVHSGYDPARIEIIKSIPGRTWDKDGKFWKIPTSRVGSLKAALEANGDQVQVIGGVAQGRSAESDAIIARLEREKQRLQQENIRLKNAQASSAQSWAEQLLCRLDPEQSEKAYRALSRILHPDVGGNTALMQQLNARRDLMDRTRR
jgi:hypothetical protein